MTGFRPAHVIAWACLLGACSSEGDLCARLGGSSECDSTARTKCEDAIAAQSATTPACADILADLVACAGKLDEVGCTGATSAYANGDGMFSGGDNFALIGGVSLVVNDSECDVIKRGYDACTTCPLAAGATSSTRLGVGDKCAADADCADGLRCDHTMCTRTCTSADQCRARARDCELGVYENTCGTVAGTSQCTRTCSFLASFDTCPFDYGAGWHCSNQNYCVR